MPVPEVRFLPAGCRVLALRLSRVMVVGRGWTGWTVWTGWRWSGCIVIRYTSFGCVVIRCIVMRYNVARAPRDAGKVDTMATWHSQVRPGLARLAKRLFLDSLRRRDGLKGK